MDLSGEVFNYEIFGNLGIFLPISRHTIFFYKESGDQSWKFGKLSQDSRVLHAACEPILSVHDKKPPRKIRAVSEWNGINHRFLLLTTRTRLKDTIHKSCTSEFEGENCWNRIMLQYRNNDKIIGTVYVLSSD